MSLFNVVVVNVSVDHVVKLWCCDCNSTHVADPQSLQYMHPKNKILETRMIQQKYCLLFKIDPCNR